MKRFLIYGFSEKELSDKLINLFNIKSQFPVGWVSKARVLSELDKSNKNIPFYVSPFPEGFPTKDIPVRLDTEDLKNLSSEEDSILYLLERDLKYKPQRHLERTLYYYQLIKYAKWILLQTKPEVVIFNEIPHGTLGYIIYLISRKKNIETFIISRAFEFDHFQIFKTIEDINRLVIDGLKDKKDIAFSNKNKADEDPFYMQQQRQKYASFFSLLRTKSNKILKLRYKNFKVYRAKKQLKKRYQSLATAESELDKLQNIIYVALHYQPERTSMPQAGIFAQQWLMIDILHKSMPANFNIVVKEHPSTFFIGGHLQRNMEFYRLLNNYENLFLADINISSSRLMKRSTIVTTLTGTVGYEALKLKKPVFNFGYSTYSYCKGAFSVRNSEECEDAFEKVLNGKLEFFEQENYANFLASNAIAKDESNHPFKYSGGPLIELIDRYIFSDV